MVVGAGGGWGSGKSGDSHDKEGGKERIILFVNHMFKRGGEVHQKQYVLVSPGCCNKVPQTGQLRIEIHGLSQNKGKVVPFEGYEGEPVPGLPPSFW